MGTEILQILDAAGAGGINTKTLFQCPFANSFLPRRE